MCGKSIIAACSFNINKKFLALMREMNYNIKQSPNTNNQEKRERYGKTGKQNTEKNHAYHHAA